mmetsp:Transcript_8045/g.19990  ORF Transcript_8045/g.19990 Transcript_8045/m.19990 type:complete len:122 (+) Transcript_8045:235-600(+)
MEEDGPGASRREGRYKMRERQWAYLGPILAAPLAHIAVSCYRHAKTPVQRYAIVGVGVVGSTVATLSMRIYLMGHAGYAGGEISSDVAAERLKLDLDNKQKEEIEKPSMWQMAQQVMKGFA